MPAAIGELYVSNFTIPGDRQWNSLYLTSVMYYFYIRKDETCLALFVTYQNGKKISSFVEFKNSFYNNGL